MTIAAWDDPATARWYRRFETRHDRYRLANAALIRQAGIRPGLRVLDLAAGTGGTTAALLPHLGPTGQVDCVEPARAMARAGQERLGPDPRVRWLAGLADAPGPYDRILCGAALWQWPDVPVLLHDLAGRLAPGGALAINWPASYLGEPDGPGGGADPYLTALHERVIALYPPAAPAAGPGAQPLPDRARVGQWLRAAGLRPRLWQHGQRLTQAAWCDWLKVPVLTAALWPGVPPDERARRIAEVARGLDPGAWRPERWLGWTAWRPMLTVDDLTDSSPLLAEPAALRARAQQDGALLVRGLLPRRDLSHLCARVIAAARAAQLLDARGGWIGGQAEAAHELPRWLDLQRAVAPLPAFQDLIGHPRLLALMSTIIGRPARGGFGSICRVAPPEHLVAATPTHRDGDYIAESRDLWTVWMPLAPCRVEEGGLAVALGSQHGDPPAGWSAADLRVGDALLFSAQTLHRACPNLRPRRPRLSVDVRFGPVRP